MTDVDTMRQALGDWRGLLLRRHCTDYSIDAYKRAWERLMQRHGAVLHAAYMSYPCPCDPEIAYGQAAEE